MEQELHLRPVLGGKLAVLAGQGQLHLAATAFVRLGSGQHDGLMGQSVDASVFDWRQHAGVAGISNPKRVHFIGCGRVSP